MDSLTDADLSRLVTAAAIHPLPRHDDPRSRLDESLQRLADEKLMTDPDPYLDYDPGAEREITPKGRAVVETMLRAGREVLSGK
jgi:hypothetical protein